MTGLLESLLAQRRLCAPYGEECRRRRCKRCRRGAALRSRLNNERTP